MDAGIPPPVCHLTNPILRPLSEYPLSSLSFDNPYPLSAVRLSAQESKKHIERKRRQQLGPWTRPYHIHYINGQPLSSVRTSIRYGRGRYKTSVKRRQQFAPFTLTYHIQYLCHRTSPVPRQMSGSEMSMKEICTQRADNDR